MDVDPDSNVFFWPVALRFLTIHLIVAAGSQISYFRHNEWQEWARGLKSIEEATTIRHKILLLGTGFTYFGWEFPSVRELQPPVC